MSQFRKIVRSVQTFARHLSGAPKPEEKCISTTRPTLGVALGGGFARGIAHIGLLKVLEEENIPVDFVGGTSVGSLIGAVYCSGRSGNEMKEIASHVRFRTFARWTLSRYGFFSNDRMENWLTQYLHCSKFEDLKIPLAVVATDFKTGEPVVFRSGSIADAVRASCAYPGMFQPVEVDGRMLVDGMLSYAVPTTPLKQMGADRVLGVYLSAHWVQMRGPRSPFDVIGQCFSIAQDRMSNEWKKDADLIVEPNVEGFSYDAFERTPELIHAGEEAMRAALPTVKKWLGMTEPTVKPTLRQKTGPKAEPQEIVPS